eukprot:NODE_11062_length_1310_cov_11.225697.p1 GENE.NODE_11062_length_1310_cov_11.225697~~NODE_11062_length_1310_cov_11.225697.p1  ORF type:complete len:328 (-),score=41.06 NODE_11062_length_1310_cov_11.225697:252-1235(-)
MCDFALHPGAPPVCLRVVSVPAIDDGCDARVLCHEVDQELSLKSLDTLAGLNVLRERFERSTLNANNAGTTEHDAMNFAEMSKKKIRWPETSRFSCPRRFWQVAVDIHDEASGRFRVEHAVLEVASYSRDRTMDYCDAAMKETSEVASYATLFNMRLRKVEGEEGGMSWPKVHVAMPHVCEVLGSSVPQLMGAGDHCLLWAYPSDHVTKYVFEGLEPFLEVPQAFFHYVACLSGGQEMACDLQGCTDENGDFLMVDPCMLRTTRLTFGTMLSSIWVSSRDEQKRRHQQSRINWFGSLHPTCGTLCHAFDPNRNPCARSIFQAGFCGL